MRIRRIAVYEKESRYHDSLVYCKMEKNKGHRAKERCDFPATSREGFCDFHQKNRTNGIMQPQKCDHRGCDRSFCGKVLRIQTKSGKMHNYAFCQLHFKRAKNGEDMFRAFNQRYNNKDVYEIKDYIPEAQFQGKQL